MPEMRDIVVSILREERMTKVIELATQVWLRQNQRQAVWQQYLAEQESIGI